MEVDPVSDEFDSLLLQKPDLFLIHAIEIGNRNSSFYIDDTVPRHIASTRKIVQRISDETSLTGKSTKFRDLSVGCDFTAGNLSDGIPDDFVIR